MVYSEMNQINNKLKSLRLGASSNVNIDNPIISPHLLQQNNHNVHILMSPEEALVKLSEQTQFPIMQENGQRRYGPPPDWTGPVPSRGCEVFIGKIPRDCFEDELVPIFQTVGRIYMFRLMMDFSGSNRGYGFCVYTNREDTKRAVQELDNYEIRKGKMLGVCLSVDNCRLFVGGIPKSKTKQEIMSEMTKVTDGVKDVIVYPSAADKGKNRGFAFVEYDNHKAAAMARRKLIPGRIQLWGHQIAVDWAEPEREVDEDVMSKVKILYVRNLMLTTTEDTLREAFNKVAGEDAVERVKKIRDYAFVHFKDRDQAGHAIRALDNSILENSRIEVSWAKPVEKTDYVRYTRGGSKNVQVQLPSPPSFPGSPQLFLDPYLTYASLYGSGPQVPGAAAAAASTAQLMAANSSNLGRNMRGGRAYRNAAGSRSANARTTPGYNVRDKKHPIEVLEEISQKSGWGAPTYTHVLVSEAVDPASGNKLPYYMGQVTIPGLCRQFNSPRLSTSPEEAKATAAEYAMALLQYQAHAVDGVTGVPQPRQSGPTGLSSPGHNFHHPLGPGGPPPYPAYSFPAMGPPSHHHQSSSSQAASLTNGLSFLSAPGLDPTQMNAGLLYDPATLLGASGLTPTSSTGLGPSPFLNPSQLLAAELYSHY